MAPFTEAKLQQLFTDLVATSHLTRSKAFLTLKTLNPPGSDGFDDEQRALWDQLEAFVRPNLSAASPWEPQQGALGAAVIMYLHASEEFRAAVVEAAVKFMDSHELRVRLAIVDCFLEIAKGPNGVECVQAALERIRTTIVDNFERKHDHDHDHGHHGQGAAAEGKEHHANGDHSGKEKPKAGPKAAEKKTSLVHDSEGFRCLETSMKILLNAAQGLGLKFGPLVTPQLLECVKRSTCHTNRYVRETGYFICKELFSSASPESLEAMVAPALAPELASGLDDNWSEVRFAASGAVRELFVKGTTFKSKYYEALIPRMLLNRYYAAQGVKVFSLETWTIVVGDLGKGLVAQYIEQIVAYYISQVDSDNFGVREASIHCMGELASRMPQDLVRPFVDSMLQAISGGFGDTSWQVRAAACQVCGHFIMFFPAESKDMLAAELYQLCLEHIPDEIWTVREAAAVAIVNLIRAYGDEVCDKVLEKVRELLPMAQQHVSTNAFQAEATKFSLEEKKKRDNDPNLHTGQVLFACCTLAPRTKKTIGHQDHGYNRQAAPWEYSDGSMYLIRELAEFDPKLAEEFIPTVLQIASLPAFPHYQSLLETIWKQMPAIVKYLGAERAISHLNPIITSLVLCLGCENRLAMNAAGYAIDDIREFVGEELFDGQCTAEQLSAMRASSYVHTMKQPPPASATTMSDFF